MLNPERLKEIENFELHEGNGKDLNSGCVMQMVSYIAGEKWTDRPECACPILTTYAIKLNDSLNKEHRQKLKPIIPFLIDTQSTEALRIKRKQFLMFRNVTSTYPLLLDLIQMPALAQKLRMFENNKKDMNLAIEFVLESKDLIKKYASTADASTAYAYAYAYASTAYAYACADAAAADASAYAADADASAYREKVAHACIETLRLACLIKE